jgi:hypothetical protein
MGVILDAARRERTAPAQKARALVIPEVADEALRRGALRVTHAVRLVDDERVGIHRLEERRRFRPRELRERHEVQDRRALHDGAVPIVHDERRHAEVLAPGEIVIPELSAQPRRREDDGDLAVGHDERRFDVGAGLPVTDADDAEDAARDAGLVQRPCLSGLKRRDARAAELGALARARIPIRATKARVHERDDRGLARGVA